MRQGDDIDHLVLFERDNWTCGICGGKIDPTLRFPHMQAATVDHIIAIICGGTHTWTNVQCSHRDCNEAKGST